MCKSWFFDLSTKPDDDFIVAVLSDCIGFEIVEHTHESHDARREYYEIIVANCGRDRMRIVIGAEPESRQPESRTAWWILVTCEPWWRNRWNRMPGILIPILTARLAQTEEG